MKVGDLIKFQDHRYTSFLGDAGDLVGMIVDMKVAPWDEVTNVKVIIAGQAFWFFRSQFREVFNETR